jgi:hypothetical protein
MSLDRDRNYIVRKKYGYNEKHNSTIYAIPYYTFENLSQKIQSNY